MPSGELEVSLARKLRYAMGVPGALLGKWRVCIGEMGVFGGEGGGSATEKQESEAEERGSAAGLSGSPRGVRGGRPVAGLSPASRRRQPGTSAGTAGAAGPRGQPRRCRGPRRGRAGLGRTGGGTTASRRRVGRGEAAAGRCWRLRGGSAPALGISSPPAAFINPSPDVKAGAPPSPHAAGGVSLPRTGKWGPGPGMLRFARGRPTVRCALRVLPHSSRPPAGTGSRPVFSPDHLTPDPARLLPPPQPQAAPERRWGVPGCAPPSPRV